MRPLITQVGPSSQPLPNRPMSPLAAPHQGTQLCGIRENQGADIENNKVVEIRETKVVEEGDRTSPTSQDREQGEFRARAASAGQQARAHVSQIVARFRQRSNSSADDKEKKRYRIVGQNVSTVYIVSKYVGKYRLASSLCKYYSLLCP